MIESSLHPSEPVTLPMRPAGAVLRSVAGYGLVTALMLASDLAIFIPAVLIHCALRNGRRATWFAIAIAVPIAAASLLVRVVPADAPLVMANLAASVLALGVPAIFAAPLFERNEPFGRVLTVLLGGAAAGYALTEIGARLFANFSAYERYVSLMGKLTAALMADYRNRGGQAADQFEQLARYWVANLQPGALLTGACIAFVLSLLLLGRMRTWRERMLQLQAQMQSQTQTQAPAQPVAENETYLFRNFALPEWVLFAFVLGGLTPFTTGVLQQIAANSLMVSVFLFVLQGFALLRYLLAAVGIGFLGALIAFAFVVLTGIGPLLLGLPGLFDPFFDFRHYKKRKDDSHESHSD